MFEPAPFAVGVATSLGNERVPDWIAALSTKTGFVADSRYHASEMETDAETVIPDDGLADAFERGRAQGLAEAAEASNRESTERRKLGSALRKLDGEMVERLSVEMSETIAVLCEATLAPLTLDTGLLQTRCANAARLLGERQADRVLHLCPQDTTALDADFATQWVILPDTTLEPGSLRIEQAGGGISDGPAQWRAQLQQALGLC